MSAIRVRVVALITPERLNAVVDRAHYHCQHQQRGAEVTPPAGIYRGLTQADMLRTVGIGIHVLVTMPPALMAFALSVCAARRWKASTVPARDNTAALTARARSTSSPPSSLAIRTAERTIQRLGGTRPREKINAPLEVVTRFSSDPGAYGA